MTVKPLTPLSASIAQSIQALTVEGFKSIDSERGIEIRPLTILAGANSAGKSSTIQPLLLLKQTLEAPYDPGPLLLNGPNVEFTSVSQFLCKSRLDSDPGTFAFGLEVGFDNRKYLQCKLHFRKATATPIELGQQDLRVVGHEFTGGQSEFRPGTTELADSPYREMLSGMRWAEEKPLFVRTLRNRCFLDTIVTPDRDGPARSYLLIQSGLTACESVVTRVIHVPGLRGNPRRNYPLTAVGDRFPGTFEAYVASVIAAWQRAGNEQFITQLGTDLRELGLTWKVHAHAVDDTQVELRVGRLPKATRDDGNDLVSIADVGFGVSQTLPVVVALLTAQHGQLVYIEQPEIHLHPRAQIAMASLLARAAKRGVRVVIETHSSLLLLGVQRLVADETLDPKLVKLHWFKRDETTGITDITSAELDPAGAFGDWPEDFDDVTLTAQQQYLDAAEKKLAHEPQEG
jgi:predicted ATPase